MVKIETRMEVERLRERLIRELRKEGSQEGKRQRRQGQNKKLVAHHKNWIVLDS